MGLATFSFANLFYGLSCNDLKASVFSRSLLSNAKLLQMSGISLGFIILANQLDLLNRLLNTTAPEHRPVGRLRRGRVGHPVGDGDRQVLPAAPAWPGSRGRAGGGGGRAGGCLGRISEVDDERRVVGGMPG